VALDDILFSSTRQNGIDEFRLWVVCPNAREMASLLSEVPWPSRCRNPETIPIHPRTEKGLVGRFARTATCKYSITTKLVTGIITMAQAGHFTLTEH
jgi:hypothetical protein